MTQEIKSKLQILLDKFTDLSKQPFSRDREDSIDDVFAGLMRLEYGLGSKDYTDTNLKKTRTRKFVYKCSDRQHHVLVEVIITKGQAGESKFNIIKNI